MLASKTKESDWKHDKKLAKDHQNEWNCRGVIIICVSQTGTYPHCGKKKKLNGAVNTNKK